MARSMTMLSAYAAAALCAGLSVVPAKADEAFRQKFAQGFKMTSADCAAVKQAVWVYVEGQGVCIRYFLSNAGGDSRRGALVYLSGDAPSTVFMRDGKLSLDVEEDYEPPSAEAIDRNVEQISKRAGATAIFLARMGMDGSSGWHAHRRTYFEVRVTNAALDLIKAKHGIDKFHLAGQSGGGHLIGALLATRTDIGCAVPGSGLLMTNETTMPADGMPASVAKIYDPTSQVLKIAKNKDARIIVLTDGSDKVVPIEKQIGFVRRLVSLGGKARHIFMPAPDAEHHQLRPYALSAAYACMNGASDDEIELHLYKLAATQLQERLAETKRKQGIPAAGAPTTPAPTAEAPTARANPGATQ